MSPGNLPCCRSTCRLAELTLQLILIPLEVGVPELTVQQDKLLLPGWRFINCQASRPSVVSPRFGPRSKLRYRSPIGNRSIGTVIIRRSVVSAFSKTSKEERIYDPMTSGDSVHPSRAILFLKGDIRCRITSQVRWPRRTRSPRSTGVRAAPAAPGQTVSK